MGSDFIDELKKETAEDRFPCDFVEAFEIMECFSFHEECETFLVRARTDNRLYVAKCYTAGHPMFALAEPEVFQKLNHPGVPRFFREYRSDSMRCVLREYVGGVGLDKLAGERRLSEEEIRRIGLRLCEILACLHEQKPPIIHRDIKPQNVIVGDNNEVFLIDFGISRVYAENAKTDTVFFGTQAFSPPEQYGFSQTDCRSDIFSLGVLLRWLLTGETESGDGMSVKSPLEKIIFRCTAFAPKDRYANVQAVKKALLASAPERRKKRRALYVVAAFFAAFCIGGFLWMQADAAGGGLTESARTEETQTEEKGPLADAFSEPLIEQAVRASLGKNDSDAVYENELAAVTELYIVAETVCTDEAGFYSAVSDWYSSPERKPGSLQSLEDLRRLPNVRKLCFAAQNISDITPLAALPRLEKIECKHNYITDVSVLEKLPDLVSVGLNGNPVSDFSPLLACKKIRLLDLCDINGYDPSFLAALGDFDFLDISNSTDSYLYLDGKKIRELKMCYTKADSLTCIAGVTGLERLEINNTEIRDLAELKNHPTLVYLRLSAIPAEDYSPLLALPNLETVVISNSAKAAVEKLGDVPFTVQYE